MIHCIEGLLQIQEDHPSQFSLVYIAIYLIKETKHTTDRGVVLPESELGLRQHIISIEVCHDLIMYYALDHFTDCR